MTQPAITTRDTGSATPAIDPDDVAYCPTRAGCEGCGYGRQLLVVTVRALDTAFCLTVCDECVTLPLPTVDALTATNRAGEHADHLGCDVDQLAAAVAGVR